MSDPTPYGYTEAKSKALWVKRYVRGAFGIQVRVDIDNGTAWVRYLNRCGIERSIHNNAEFVAVRESEA